MTQHPGIEENTTATESGVERVLGRIRGERAGPTLICVGGLHGNEPAGLQGLRRVLDGLQGPKGGFAAGTNGGSTAGTKGGSTAHVNGALAGDLVALAGNLTALSRGCRFIGRDLNRAWGNDRMSSLMENGGPLKSCPEDHEQIELLAALDEAVADARGQVYVLDIHTTSGPGGAFTTAGDTLRNRAFALSLEVPFVLGLEELVDGTMLEYMGRRGFIAALFEGGQHDEPEAVDRVEAAVWVALEAAGLIPRDVVPQVAKGRERLSREAIGQPPVLEMRHKYHIEPGSGFLMRPGYENFKPVRGGEVLGRNGGGEVRSPEAGRILMPLYQEQGDDGFFHRTVVPPCLVAGVRPAATPAPRSDHPLASRSETASDPARHSRGRQARGPLVRLGDPPPSRFSEEDGGGGSVCRGSSRRALDSIAH